MPMGPGGYGFGPHWDFSWVWPLMIVFFSLGGWRRFAGHQPGHHRRYDLPPQATSEPVNDPALTTLRERFARGEIDRAEYEERRAALLDRPLRTATVERKPKEVGKTDEKRPEWPDLADRQ